MKAWYVQERNADCGEIHWADTAGKAKMSAYRRGEWVNLDGGTEWTAIECRRAPSFDGEPRELTCRDWLQANYRCECGDCMKADCPFYASAEES